MTDELPTFESKAYFDLIEERDEALARAEKAAHRERFAFRCLRSPDPEPCRNCGRCVLVGVCCDNPDFPPWPPAVSELAGMLHAAEAALASSRAELAAVGATIAPLYTSQERVVLMRDREVALQRAEKAERERDEARAALNEVEKT